MKVEKSSETEKKSRNSSASIFGYEYQHVAAISLMMVYMKKMKNIRVEGEEDIEITLDDGIVFAQAKSAMKGSKDATTKFKEALETLQDSCKDPRCRDVIYTTNIEEMFGSKTLEKDFEVTGTVAYRHLSTTNKKIVDEYLKNYVDIDKDKLYFHRLKFVGEEETKYKWIKGEINQFLLQKKYGERISREKLFESWARYLKHNSTDKKITTVPKEKIEWGLIIQLIDNPQKDPEDFDSEQVEREYRNIINEYAECYEIVTKIINDYSAALSQDKTQYLYDNWNKFEEIFSGIEDMEIKKKLTIGLMDRILCNKTTIKSIKEELN